MSEKKTFYITTPIYYPSDNPHIGHAYTTVACDSMNRYKKMRGFDSYFLTGTDEHGQKLQRRAADAGMEPKEFIDGIILKFKDLWRTLMIDYDDFIRTTDDRHKKYAQDLFQAIYDKGDIYKAEYEGWYCIPCETFFTARQASEDKLCPDCGRPLETMKEESYFFKMSKYTDAWLKFIEENPDFIRPESRRKEMVNFVKQGLEDLCVSRTTFDWGIKVPFDQRHVIYVWFDALINYISALKENGEGKDIYNQYWPADVHMVGKDIIRFHTIIWPIILMAADLPLPKCVLGHGWVLIDDGKMSKSKGNVVDPIVLSQKYSPDAIRYFLMREMGYGLDCNYTEEGMALRINTDLANDYGNLLSRATGMLNKFQEGIIIKPTVATEFDAELIALAEAMPQRFGDLMDQMRFSDALAELWKLVNKANKYIDDTAPWALNKNGEKDKLAAVLYNIAETMRIVTIMATPIMPAIAQKVWQQLNITEQTELHSWDSLKWGLLPGDIKINRGEPLFPRLDLENIDQLPLKTENQQAAKASDAPQAVATEEEFIAMELEAEVTIDQFKTMDMRVVKVLACEKVPKTDKLLKFDLQMGTERRTIISGIAEFYQPEELVGKNLIAIANLKPVKIRGIVSKGMLLSAVNDADHKLELLEVPSIESGTRIS